MLYRSWTDADGIAWRRGHDLPDRRPQTLPEFFAACRVQHGSRTVLIEAGDAWSWESLFAASARLAGHLQKGVHPGDRVLLLAGNSPSHLVIELACWRLGAVPAPVCPRLDHRTVLQLIQVIDPVLVIHDPEVALPALPVTRLDTASARRLTSGNTGVEDSWHPAQTDTVCLLLLTGGSTGGHPRVVQLSHGNLTSQQAAFGLLWPDIGPGDHLTSYLPWYHSFGSLAERLWALGRGAAMHLVPRGGHDHEALIRGIRDNKTTVFMSVPKMHALLAEADAFPVTSLRWVFNAGAPLGEQTEAFFSRKRIRVHEGWGLTECSPSATITPPDRPRRPGIVGQPIPGVEVGVREQDGRIFVRGPGVMPGYLNEVRATLGVLEAGRLDTGDLGTWTAEGLQLIGRADALLKLPNGEKVHAGSLERALEENPLVRHAVVGVDGALIAALIAGPEVSDQDLAAVVAQVNHAQAIPFLRIQDGYRVNPGLHWWQTASHKVARRLVLDRLHLHRRKPGPAFSILPIAAPERALPARPG